MRGKLIVIEGLDGSGKATQTQILKEKLLDMSISVTAITFPDYESDSSAPIKMYLNGELGLIDDVNVYAASSFYSIDRYISFKTKWEKSYEEGGIILSDRYTTSNICHQMSKLPAEKREEYIKWLYSYEFELLKIPPPDLVIYLDMAPEASQKLISNRYKGDEKKKDLHESNFEYLLKCRDAALFAANRLGWKIVCCNGAENNPLTIKEISEKIYKTIVEDKLLEGLC